MNIFISHDNQDSYHMSALQTLIQKSKFFTPIVIVRQKEVMLDFVEKVQFGLNVSYYFMPILTELSYRNIWVNQEIGYALGKGLKPIPIVEEALRMKLNKGFIHNYRDLPYSFNNSEPNKKIFRRKYREVCESAIKGLIQFHNYSDSNCKLITNIFKGHWRTEFDTSIVFKEYCYYVNDKLEFYVDQFYFDENINKITFRKLRPNKNEIFKVELSIKTPGKYYVGTEKSSTDNGKTWSKPYNITFTNSNSTQQGSSHYLDENPIIIGSRTKSKFHI